MLVEALWAAGAVGFIQGAPKLGKTWLLMHLAICVVTGRLALGRFAIPSPGPVVVVLEESSTDATRRRLAKLAAGQGVDADELDNLHLYANAGVRLSDRGWVTDLLAVASEIQPIMFALDPWARVKGAGVDENVQRDVAAVLDTMRELHDVSGAAVPVVHHTGHEGTRLRGSSDLEAFWQSKLSLKAAKGGAVTLTAEHREAEAASPVLYRATVTDDAATLAVIDTPEKQGRDLAAEVVAYLADHQGATTSEVRAGVGCSRADLLDLLADERRFVYQDGPRNAKRWTLVPSDPSRPSGNNSEQVAGRSPTRPVPVVPVSIERRDRDGSVGTAHEGTGDGITDALMARSASLPAKRPASLEALDQLRRTVNGDAA
jgi:hypothetical protein